MGKDNRISGQLAEACGSRNNNKIHELLCFGCVAAHTLRAISTKKYELLRSLRSVWAVRVVRPLKVRTTCFLPRFGLAPAWALAWNKLGSNLKQESSYANANKKTYSEMTYHA